MSESKKIRLIRNYSEIDELQTEYTVIYSINENSKGAELSVEHKEKGKDILEKCVCEGMKFAEAEKIMQFLYENSCGIYSWLNILEDLNIQYVKL